MRALLYARVSTSDGRQNIEAQVSEMKQFCKTRRWTIVTTLKDQRSGASEKRPLLDQALSFCQSQTVDVILVSELSRISRRGPADVFGTIAAIRATGAQFWSVREPQFSGPQGDLLVAVAAYMAQAEREQIQSRIKAGMAEAMRAGKHCGRPRRILDGNLLLKLRAQGKSLSAIAAVMNAKKTTIARRIKQCEARDSMSTPV